MHSKIYTVQTAGLLAKVVVVEVDLTKTTPGFTIVGLPDKAVEEAKDRISSAIKNSGFKQPTKGSKKVIVSLAPADFKKEGTQFDLAIALACLLATAEINFNPSHKLFVGELSLYGEVRPIPGILLLLQKAKQDGFTEVYIPIENTKEASLINGLKVFGVKDLKEIIFHLDNSKAPKGTLSELSPIETVSPRAETVQIITTDFADVRGQAGAKRALVIAAAGGHNIGLSGPPGTGKTLLAKALAGILPPLSIDEIIEVTGIHSIAGANQNQLIIFPPYRSPHHTASYVSLIGGGTNPRPGEITLAHRGVLFLDEFPEFDKRVIEALRQPLEEKVVTVARAKLTTQFPAQVILVAAMNPCPCGFKGHPRKECICLPRDLMKYERKLSGPIMDRIDLWVTVPAINHETLRETKPEESSKHLRERVMAARAKQQERYRGTHLKLNSELNLKEINQFIPLASEVESLLLNSAKKLDLSARAFHRVIKLSRTIADLNDSPEIKTEHLLEALQYRPKILS